MAEKISWRLARVVEIRAETPTVKSLVLDVPEWPAHLAGQRVDVRLTAEDGYQAERSYSIASAPEDKYLMLTVERIEDGEVSPYLTDELRVGDLLELRGPIGGYFVWEARSAHAPLLLVAGGSGVVPLMSMLRHRAAAASEIPVRLLYSSRGYEDIIYREELDKLSAGDSALRVFHTLTRGQPAGWNGFKRRIDRAMLEETAWPPSADPLAYVCGPTALVETVAALLLETGYPPDRIKTERFGPTGA